MEEEQLESLLGYLDSLIAFQETAGDVRPVGCDSTFNKSVLWLLARGYDVAAAVDWLRGRGASCDCEVLQNAAPGAC